VSKSISGQEPHRLRSIVDQQTCLTNLVRDSVYMGTSSRRIAAVGRDSKYVELYVPVRRSVWAALAASNVSRCACAGCSDRAATGPESATRRGASPCDSRCAELSGIRGRTSSLSAVSDSNWKFELTASNVRMVTDAPRGAYIPVSHSLIVCCRIPISRESAVCESPRWVRRARMLSACHLKSVGGACLVNITRKLRPFICGALAFFLHA
jgi:hypothetical protein